MGLRELSCGFPSYPRDHQLSGDGISSCVFFCPGSRNHQINLIPPSLPRLMLGSVMGIEAVGTPTDGDRCVVVRAQGTVFVAGFSRIVKDK